ncbi:hypothetical protein C0Z11_01740 [Acidipropionibacterium jensenii]|uniref:hypothetical protein n=1 Tax=Acidipropionibacterium jensenii TaxID=1749 RepID=UPI000BEF0D98|nr:hypothetical protein [Acidipropionibacterium jensenii]AZZ41219.1 hypothetical protein C0Z11_01740 [Acidipropionibacterium jensenii]
MGALETTCPRCALDLRLAGAVRLTDPALDALARQESPDLTRPRVRRPTPPGTPHSGLPGPVQAGPSTTGRPGGGHPGARPGPSAAVPPGPLDEAVTRVIPAFGALGAGGSDDPDATRVMPVMPAPGREQDSEMTQVIGQSAPDEAPRLLNPPTPHQSPSRPSSRVVPRPQGHHQEGSLPSTWFRDPQAEYARAVRAPGESPAPVFNAPPAPRPAPEPPSLHHGPQLSENRRLVPLLVIILLVALAVLAGLVWWVFSGFTSKAVEPLPSTGTVSAPAVPGAA